jgi:hypothetical protein
MHRKLGPRDLYALYNAPKGAQCSFRATGTVELWDPWTGSVRPLAIVAQTASGTKLKLPLTEKEIQLIVFSPGQPQVEETTSSAAPNTTNVIEGDWEFELQPTSDNRFGDFHWPPTQGLIGAEARQVWYCEGDQTNGPWRKVTCSFGPQFVKCAQQPANPLVRPPDGELREFSWRWGMENDPGHQGYHGLKEQVDDAFLAIGKATRNATGTSYASDGADSFLWTTVFAPRDLKARALTGDLKPARVWLNGGVVTGAELQLVAGPNTLLLQYTKPGRTWFVVSETVDTGAATDEPSKFKVSPLAMSWKDKPGVLPFDVRPDEKTPVGWYRFVAPPGLRAMTLAARGKVQAWADGVPMKGINKLIVPQSSAKPVTVLLRIEQERGCYGGAALTEPIKLDCGPGEMALGDWSKIDGLLSYSGGAWYRKTVRIPAARQVTLNLGNVAASAEVRVNGQPAGVRVAPPWTLDITRLVKAGENRIEILVCNTLANHYTTIPTSYRGSTLSGLLGPVKVELIPRSAAKSP